MSNVNFLGKNIKWNDLVKFGNNVTICDNVIIEDDVIIGDNCSIGYYEKDNDDITIIKKGSRLRSGSIIYHGCIIGENSAIGHNTILRDKTIIGNNTIIGALVMCEGDSVIGNNVLINAQCHITRFCNIGDYTFFGPGIMSTNDRSINYKRIGHGSDLKGFTTEKYVRIAGGVNLMPGVVLKEGCVIGLGSIVTKDVEAYILVTGSPARFVRKLDDNESVCIIK